MGWKNGFTKKERRNGGYQYGWDRPISYVDVAQFLKKYYQKKKRLRNEKLIIISGCHGSLDQYKRFKGLDLFVPEARFEERKFYKEDLQTLKELNIKNLGIKKSLSWLLGYILCGVILLDMTKKLHRVIFYFLSQKSNVNILHGQCFGRDNGFFENSLDRIKQINNLINKKLLIDFGIGAIIGAVCSYIGIKIAQHGCSEEEKLSSSAILRTVVICAVVGGVVLAISPGLVPVEVACGVIAAATAITGYVVQKLKILWKRRPRWMRW